VQVDEARSFNSALKALCDRTVKYDVVLLDMSMPNFDVSETEPSGGAQENFAGRDLLTQMKMRQRKVPTIVVTMFDGFGEGAGRVSIENLHAEMVASFPDFYVGHVYYSQAEDAWKTGLEKLLKGISR
jgi:CheY-like chemotaxis protein